MSGFVKRVAIAFGLSVPGLMLVLFDTKIVLGSGLTFFGLMFAFALPLIWVLTDPRPGQWKPPQRYNLKELLAIIALIGIVLGLAMALLR
jgi:hypothetical protein